MTGTLWRITAPHFCAALIVADGKVSDAAPILAWSIGKDWPWMRDYCKRKGWAGENLSLLRESGQ